MESMVTLFFEFREAVFAGLIISVVCSILGVFVICKRLVFIGITLSETATCGVALAFILGWPAFGGASLLTLVAVAIAAYPYETTRIPRDTVIGLLFVIATAMTILLVSKSGFGIIEVKSLLYGDLILASGNDLRVIIMVMIPVMAGLLMFIRPILYSFVDREAYRVMGGRPAIWEAVYFVALGLAVSAASKITGPLLVFCYLLVSPTVALLVSRRFNTVLLLSALTGITGTLLGYVISFRFDLPTNQTVCICSCVILLIAVVGKKLLACFKTTGISSRALSA